MNHRERFIRTVERKPVDRPATWLGMPVPEAIPGLLEYFKVSTIDDVKKIINDDIYQVEIPYRAPDCTNIALALKFSKTTSSKPFDRSLTAPGFFEDYSDPASIEAFSWPDPSQYIDPIACRSIVSNVPEGYAVMGVLWSCHFQDACSAFGMETALVKMITEPDMLQAVIDRITEFYLQANEIFYQSTAGKLDAVLIGNDLGSQTGLIISPESFRTFVLPGTIKLVNQAKRYGLKVIYHSCGAVFDIISDLIEAGVDVLHPIQALAVDMNPYQLKKSFGDLMSFCGGVDAQHLLVNGEPDQIAEKVRELKKLFPTGLIISPSHEAILPDVNPKNVEALFNAAFNEEK